jgi:invasion protein IalB
MNRIQHKALAILFSGTFLAAAALPAAAQRQASTGSDQPSLLGQYGDWGAYTGTSGGHKVCFALAKPESSQTNPPNRPRDPIYLFVSARPAENVRNEISFMMGYPLKPNSDGAADISGMKFALQTQADGAWVKNAAEEGRMVDSMRKGADLVVHGTSSRGTTTTDRYSLKGLSQALDRVAQECR